MPDLSYSEYKNTVDYITSKTGADFTVEISLDGDPSFEPIARGMGLTLGDTFDRVAIPEWGKNGIDEHADGQMSGAGSLQFFMTGKLNDKLDTRETFAGRKYTIIQRKSDERTHKGQVYNCLLGVKLTANNIDQGPTGFVGQNVSFVYTEKLNGQQFADRFGDQRG